MEYMKRACHIQMEDEIKLTKIKSFTTRSFLSKNRKQKGYMTRLPLPATHIIIYIYIYQYTKPVSRQYNNKFSLQYRNLTHRAIINRINTHYQTLVR